MFQKATADLTVYECYVIKDRKRISSSELWSTVHRFSRRMSSPPVCCMSIGMVGADGACNRRLSSRLKNIGYKTVSPFVRYKREPVSAQVRGRTAVPCFDFHGAHDTGDSKPNLTRPIWILHGCQTQYTRCHAARCIVCFSFT